MCREKWEKKKKQKWNVNVLEPEFVQAIRKKGLDESLQLEQVHRGVTTKPPFGELDIIT